MLILPIKHKWFDMELLGEKPEEYREIKRYYISRFRKILGEPNIVSDEAFIERLKNHPDTRKFRYMFRNGYRKDSPSFIAKCTLSVGTGKEEWGAEKGKEYFVLTINEKVSTCKKERNI